MNKASIREQFKSILGRNDITDSQADAFIQQSFARIQRTLRVPAMEKIVETTFGGESYIPIPNDLLSIKNIYVEGQGTLDFIPLGRFMSLTRAVGQPEVFTRVGGELRVWPTPPSGTVAALLYIGETPDLVADTDSNFLTVLSPDLLIYGALAFAADHFLDDRKQVFEDTFARAYTEVEEQARLVEMEQSGMVMGPPPGLEY